MTLLKLDGSTPYKCKQCDRKVVQTTHTIEGVKVDYYITAWERDKTPVVLCVDCHKEK